VSFIGRAAVWTHVSGGERGPDVNQSRHRDQPRLTPLNAMTGSRLAGRNGVVRWVGGPTWDDLAGVDAAPGFAEQLRRPAQHLFDALSRRSNRQQDPRMCPRCGQAPHNDWGHEYERLVCMEITVA